MTRPTQQPSRCGDLPLQSLRPNMIRAEATGHRLLSRISEKHPHTLWAHSSQGSVLNRLSSQPPFEALIDVRGRLDSPGFSSRAEAKPLDVIHRLLVD